jgi:hypothetical protein
MIGKMLMGKLLTVHFVDSGTHRTIERQISLEGFGPAYHQYQAMEQRLTSPEAR